MMTERQKQAAAVVGAVNTPMKAYSIIRSHHENMNTGLISVIICDKERKVIDITQRVGDLTEDWHSTLADAVECKGHDGIVIAYNKDGKRYTDDAHVKAIGDLHDALNDCGISLYDVLVCGEGKFFSFADERLYKTE